MQVNLSYLNGMQLSMFSDYVFRVIVHLASSPDKMLSARQIADIHDAKYNHMAKVCGWLVSEGYAVSLRGRGGGLKLAGEPKDINIGVLVRKLEADKPLVECFDPCNGNCRLRPACGLSIALRQAQEAFYSCLDEFDLASVIGLSPNMPLLLQRLNNEMLDSA